MHQNVDNVLQTLVHTNPPQNMAQARDIIDDALATAMHVMHSTVATPCAVLQVLLLLHVICS